jgi:hypothetical protein
MFLPYFGKIAGVRTAVNEFQPVALGMAKKLCRNARVI